MVTIVAMNHSRTPMSDPNPSCSDGRAPGLPVPTATKAAATTSSHPATQTPLEADSDENDTGVGNGDGCEHTICEESGGATRVSTSPSVVSAVVLMRPPPWEEHCRSNSRKRSDHRGGTSANRSKSDYRTATTTTTSPYLVQSQQQLQHDEGGDDSSTTCSDFYIASHNTIPDTNSLITSGSEVSSHRSMSRRVRILEAGGASSVNADSAASITGASSTGGAAPRGGSRRQQQQQQQAMSMMMQSYNDQPLIDPSAALNFAMEHRIFLKAALGLLTERDLHAPELGMMDPIVLKAGALKKASHLMNGVWKVKYVEIRRGMFSYYENAISSSTMIAVAGRGGSGSSGDPELLLRKNIPLEAAVCTCRAVKLHQKALNFSPGGAIFELAQNHGKTTTTRLWMATSREERQAWIHAINNAMVGGSVTRGDSVVDHRGIVRTVSGRSPFKNDLRKYLKIQSALRSAKSSHDYLINLRELLNQSLEIPVKWIATQNADKSGGGGSAGDGGSESALGGGGAFAEETVARSVDQLWRDLQRDAVQIDGAVFRGDSSHGPDRILGALTRCILQYGASHSNSSSRSDLRESKALVYARDILLAGNRTRSGGDSYYCVSSLCQNSELVVVVPSAAEVMPVAIDVSEDDSDESFHTRFNDKSGWIKTRNKLQRTWRKQFFVLSEGTLSYYEGAVPRPHGLCGQRVLTDVIISVAKKKANEHGNPSNCDQFILTIAIKDSPTKDRLLLFENEDRLMDWVYALECVSRAMASSDMSARKVNRRKSANGGDPQIVASSMGDILNEAQQSTMEHALKVGLDRDDVAKRPE